MIKKETRIDFLGFCFDHNMNLISIFMNYDEYMR